MSKIQFTKSDHLRCASVLLMRDIRAKHLQLSKEAGASASLIQQIKDADHFGIGQLEVTAATINKTYSDQLGIKMQAFGLVADGGTPPFVFEDKQLVQNILDSRIGKIPMEALKLPFKTFIIDLPEPVEFPDGSGDKWDTGVIMNVESVGSQEAETLEQIKEVFAGPVTRRMICSFHNSTNDLFMWYHFPIHEVGFLEDGALIGPDGEERIADSGDFFSNTVSKAMLMIAKLVFFLTSPNCKTTIEHRPKPSVDIPFTHRHYFQTVRKVKMDDSVANDHIGDPTGRHIGVRHTVRGHFKHFTIGKLAGRVLWCPPHWRGPEVGLK